MTNDELAEGAADIELMRHFKELVPLLPDRHMAAALKWMIDYRTDYMRKRDAAQGKAKPIEGA